MHFHFSHLGYLGVSVLTFLTLQFSISEVITTLTFHRDARTANSRRKRCHTVGELCLRTMLRKFQLELPCRLLVCARDAVTCLFPQRLPPSSRLMLNVGVFSSPHFALMVWGFLLCDSFEMLALGHECLVFMIHDSELLYT
jgi:hypothetical protein